MEITLESIINELKAWFPPEQHKERKLPGGGKWFYLPHQTITQRLNEVCPGHWSTKVNNTVISGDYTVIYLELTICGVTRTGVADNLTDPELNDEGKRKIIGSPVVNAFRHAFRDAAEQFGIGSYLDAQTANKTKFVQYMSKQGDMRAYKAYYDNQWGDKRDINPKESKKVENAGLLAATGGDLSDPNKSKGKPISQNQIGRMMAIASKAGFTDEGLSRLIAEYGYTSKKDITFTYDGGDYAAICERLIEEFAAKYNAKPIAEAPTGLRPQNNAVFATLIKILGFEQARFDFYFSRAFPGLSADMLSADQTNQAIKAVCKAFAQNNTDAIAAIDNTIISKTSLGVPLKDCLIQWQQDYGLRVLQPNL